MHAAFDSNWFEEIQQWYVVFQRLENPRTKLWHWLLNKSFVHCLLVRELPDGTVMIIDPRRWGVSVRFVNQPFEQFLVDHAHQCTAMLGFTADYRRLDGYKARCFYTCVSVCKSILGLKKCLFVQTPFALYKVLVRCSQTTIVKPYVPYVKGE